MTLASQVRDRPEVRQFQLDVAGETAFIAYRLAGNTLTMTHTEVPGELEGQGIGTALVQGALALVRERGQQLIPQCPFVQAYLERHTEDQDLVFQAEQE